jgi:Histone RNA hairpin-binding protein RNA-binding domain
VYRATPSANNKTTKRCNGSSSGGRGSGNTNHANNSQTLDSANRHDSKRQKMDWDLEPFDKLHPNENAQRILSRYKMILKGKNTVGYTQYIEQVPKQQRRIRSMDTPNTPDHNLDIPAKRWQGLVKAWYEPSFVPL